jgi:hypothetical protein
MGTQFMPGVVPIADPSEEQRIDQDHLNPGRSEINRQFHLVLIGLLDHLAQS